MRVLVAPQEFKGSLSAEEAAEAMATGLKDAMPGAEIDLLPLSDGGPGFIDAFRRAIRTDVRTATVQDALGRPVLARYLVTRDTGDVIIESAQANGLMHVTDDERDALRADTFGVGQLVLAAAKSAPRRIVVGVGGSATTDGGAGMAMALGARFTTESGEPLPRGPRHLGELARIDWSPPAVLRGIEFVVATDVSSPLTGPAGAAVVYGPQKGASPEDVDVLDAGLVRYAAVVRRSLGVDVERLPGAGAAGGLAAGMVAFLGARLVSGFEMVAELTNLEQRIARADVVVTGEGSFDAQSLQGKTTGCVIELARKHGKRVAVLAGRSDVASSLELTVFTIAAIEPDRERAMRLAAGRLRHIGQELATDLLANT